MFLAKKKKKESKEKNEKLNFFKTVFSVIIEKESVHFDLIDNDF